MKNILRNSNFGFTKWGVSLIAGLMTFATTGWGQSNPTAQSLPYSVNFGTTTFTTLPAGVAAWNGVSGGSASTQALAEASTPTGNATIATATASTTTGGVFGYAVSGDAKLYIQTSGNASNGASQAAIAINTTGLTSIVLSYTVDSINAGAAIVGIVAQYRVGTSGSWTTISASSGSNPYSQNGGTTGLKTTVTATLPLAANNQSVVQIRWATWRNTSTGSTSSSGIAIDNISVTGSSAPTGVSNGTAGSFTSTGVTITGSSVTADGGSAITERGVAYGTSPSPTTANSKVAASGTTGSFNVSLTGLDAGATYYARAYAINGVGTTYASSDVTVLTVPGAVATPTSASVSSSGFTVNWPATTGATSYRLDVDDNSDFGSPLSSYNNLTFNGTSQPVSGLASGTTYYVRVRAANSSGVGANSGTLTETTSAASGLLGLSGSLSAFTLNYGSASTSQSFSVAGSDLNGTAITVAPPAGFEVATTSDFSTTIGTSSSPLSLGTSASINTTVYVRLASTTDAGSYGGDITVAGGGASSQAIAIPTSSVTKVDQTITFGSLPSENFVPFATFTLSATASSGLPVSYSSSNTGVATVAGNTVTIVGAGTTTITASQSGNVNYNAATSVDQTLTVIKADQTISGVDASISKVGGDAAYSLGATVSSGLTLTYATDNPSVATVSSAGLVTIVGAGTANLTVSQAGNSNYNAAPTVTQVLTVAKTAQTITFTPITTPRSTADGPFTLAATASSGLAVTISSSDPSVAMVTGSSVTITGPGTTTLTASQGGNAGFDAAPSVNQTLTVTAAPPLIAAWDFQTTANGGTAAAAAPATPVVYNANFGSGTIYLDGSNGSSSWLVAASNTQLNAFSGASVNASSVVGMATTTATPASLAVLGGSSNIANGKTVSFKFSMLGRKDLVVSYASQATSSGFTSQLWEYSADGSVWTTLQTVSGMPTSFDTFTLNTVTALNGDPEVYLRVRFNGATASSGNNRLDNIQLRASANFAPTDITLSANTIAENNAVNAEVGTLSTTDSDVGDSSIYTLVSGTGDADNASFNINGASLRAGVGFDFETKSSYSVRVRTTDSANNTFEKAFTIRVEDLPEALTYSSWLGALTPSDAAFLDYVFGAVTPGTLDPSLKPTVAVTGGNLVLTYNVRQGTSGLTVTPKTSADLAAGPSGWVTTDVTIADVGAARTVNGVSVQQKTASVPVSGAKKFLRVEAVQE
jgi:hypothetical protein